MKKVKKVLFVNSSPMAIQIGNSFIAAGGQAVFDRAEIPQRFVKFIAAENADGTGTGTSTSTENKLLDILDGSIAEIETALDGLDVDQLKELQAVEESGANRKGALSAISAELLALDNA